MENGRPRPPQEIDLASQTLFRQHPLSMGPWVPSVSSDNVRTLTDTHCRKQMYEDGPQVLLSPEGTLLLFLGCDMQHCHAVILG